MWRKNTTLQENHRMQMGRVGLHDYCNVARRSRSVGHETRLAKKECGIDKSGTVSCPQTTVEVSGSSSFSHDECGPHYICLRRVPRSLVHYVHCCSVKQPCAMSAVFRLSTITLKAVSDGVRGAAHQGSGSGAGICRHRLRQFV